MTFVTPKSGSASLPHTSEDDYTWSTVVQTLFHILECRGPTMNLYSIMLFIHVSGAICLFIGFGIWLFGIVRVARTSRVEQVRTLADLMLMVRLVVPASALLVIAAGLTMAL